MWYGAVTNALLPGLRRASWQSLTCSRPVDVTASYPSRLAAPSFICCSPQLLSAASCGPPGSSTDGVVATAVAGVLEDEAPVPAVAVATMTAGPSAATQNSPRAQREQRLDSQRDPPILPRPTTALPLASSDPIHAVTPPPSAESFGARRWSYGVDRVRGGEG